MLLGFNIVDLLVVFFVVIYAALIFKRGFLVELFEFLGFALSLFLAILFSPYISYILTLVKLPTSIANTVAFVLIWVLTGLFFLHLSKTVFKKLPMVLILSKFNRYFGIIPNLLSSLLIVIFIATTVVVLPTATSIKTTLTQSKIVGTLLPLTIGLSAPLETAFSSSVRDGLIHLTSKEPNSNSFVRLSFPNLQLTHDIESEKILFNLLNGTRQANGLESLWLDPTLTTIASEHSKAMFLEGYFGHVDPKGKNPYDRAIAAGMNFNTLAENISYAPDVLTAQNGFINSPTHLKAILSPKYFRVGIGVYDSGIYGKMFTEEFSN